VRSHDYLLCSTAQSSGSALVLVPDPVLIQSKIKKPDLEPDLELEPNPEPDQEPDPGLEPDPDLNVFKNRIQIP
jgi:hypothetical protein